MDKNEDLDLLELQELALKHKSSKRQKTLEEKQMIVKAHLLNHVPIPQLCVDFGITRTTIYRWISTFADGKVRERISKGIPNVKPNPLSMPKKQNVEEKNLVPNSEDACRREGQGPVHGPSLPAVWQELAGILPAQEHVRQATAYRGDGCPIRQGDTAAGSWYRRREAPFHVP